MTDKPSVPQPAAVVPAKVPLEKNPEVKKVPEIGGTKGPDPTRYGDWERNGRCIDF